MKDADRPYCAGLGPEVCGNRARWRTPAGLLVCGRHRYPRHQRSTPWPDPPLYRAKE